MKGGKRKYDDVKNGAIIGERKWMRWQMGGSGFGEKVEQGRGREGGEENI